MLYIHIYSTLEDSVTHTHTNPYVDTVLLKTLEVTHTHMNPYVVTETNMSDTS